MVFMEGVLSLCRVTVTLFGRLPGVPEGLQVFSVSQIHSWWGVCFAHVSDMMFYCFFVVVLVGCYAGCFWPSLEVCVV